MHFDREKIVLKILGKKENKLTRWELEHMTKNQLKAESFKYGRDYK